MRQLLVSEGVVVSPFYDPMLGKLIAWGQDHEQARLRLLAMLDEFAIGGLKTNIIFLRRILAHPAFSPTEIGSSGRPSESQGLPDAGHCQAITGPHTENLTVPSSLPRDSFSAIAGQAHTGATLSSKNTGSAHTATPGSPATYAPHTRAGTSPPAATPAPPAR